MVLDAFNKVIWKMGRCKIIKQMQALEVSDVKDQELYVAMIPGRWARGKMKLANVKIL